MKDGPSKEVVSNKGEVNMGYSTIVASKAGFTKELVYHEGGVSKGVL